MGHYLVVAHQTATSPELLSRAKEIAAEDRGASFALLIPATHPTHLLHWTSESRFVWDEERTYRIAEDKAREARMQFEQAGLKVERTSVGDASPLLAMEDELRLRPDHYDTIVLSTLPAGRSRWLMSGIGSQVSKFGMPVIHVGREPLPSRASMLTSRLHAPRPLRALAAGGERTTLVVIVALMLVYLTGGVLLAINVNRGFLLNDAMALLVYSVIVGGLAFASWRGSMR